MSARRGERSGEALAGLVRRITARDRWLLEMLHEHTVLTTTHLATLGFAASVRATQERLRELAGLGVLDRFRPLRERGSAPWHLLLGPLGAQILAAEYGLDLAALGYRRERLLAVSHRITLDHDVATTALVCGLAAAPALRVRTWWSPTRCRRLLGHHTRPDAYLHLTAHTGPTAPGHRSEAGTRPGSWEMFVEYDTGTTPLGVLGAKLRGYHSLAEATGVVVPVGVWITRPGREPGARRALAAAHQALPHPDLVPVLTATASAACSGAAGRVWLPLRQPPGTPAGRPPVRVGLAELAHPAPRPTLAAVLDPHPDPGLDRADTLAPGPAHSGSARVYLPAPPPHPPHHAPAAPPAAGPTASGSTASGPHHDGHPDQPGVERHGGGYGRAAEREWWP